MEGREADFRMPPTAGTYTLRLRPQGVSLQVAPGATLLESVLAAGIAAPHSCTMGYCGSCRGALRAGVIAYPSGQLMDAAAENAPDEIMLCIARPRSDLEVELRFA